MGYQHKALAGFGWNGLLRVAIAALAFIKIAFLARLLSPADFGLFSLVLISLGLSEAITQTGVNITIIQSKQQVAYFLDSAWVIAIVRGLAIGCLVLGLGVGLAHFYNEPDLMMLGALAAAIPVIKGFINPAIVSFQKDLHFFKDSLFRVVVIVVESGLAIWLGWATGSVLGLVGALVGSALFEVGLSFAVMKLRPKFVYHHSRAKLIFTNAKGLTLTSILLYLFDNLDDLILGKTLGTHQLGLYHNGYGLSHKLSADVARTAGHATLPVYTRINHDVHRFRTAVTKTIGFTQVVAVLATLPLILLPDLVVQIVLGSQWSEVVPILPWLAIAGWAHTFSLNAYTVFLSKATYALTNVHLLLSVLLMAIALLVGSSYGLLGAVIGLTLSRIPGVPLLGWGLAKLLNPKT